MHYQPAHLQASAINFPCHGRESSALLRLCRGFKFQLLEANDIPGTCESAERFSCQ